MINNNLTVTTGKFYKTIFGTIDEDIDYLIEELILDFSNYNNVFSNNTLDLESLLKGIYLSSNSFIIIKNLDIKFINLINTVKSYFINKDIILELPNLTFPEYQSIQGKCHSCTLFFTNYTSSMNLLSAIYENYNQFENIIIHLNTEEDLTKMENIRYNNGLISLNEDLKPKKDLYCNFLYMSNSKKYTKLVKEITIYMGD